MKYLVTISFEVFPPKKETNFDEVEKAARQIADLHPNFMSVTYGAGGTNNKNTAHLAADIQNKTSTPVLAHLTCVSSTKEQVASVIHTYEDLGIDSIMALRGDLPKDGKVSPDYTHAIDLIRDIKAINPNLCIGGACYPEGHVECERQSEDIQHLKEKVDAAVAKAKHFVSGIARRIEGLRVQIISNNYNKSVLTQKLNMMESELLTAMLVYTGAADLRTAPQK